MERRSSSESQQIQLATESGRANIATGEVLTVDLDEDSEIDSEDDDVIRATKNSLKKRKKFSTNNNESGLRTVNPYGFIFINSLSYTPKNTQEGSAVMIQNKKCIMGHPTGAKKPEYPDTNPWLYDTIGDPGEA